MSVEKSGKCDYGDKDKFMMLMINNGTFQKKVLDAVKSKDQQKLDEILADCSINLTDTQINSIMNWQVNNPMYAGYQNIVDISKNVYDPDAGFW